MRKGRISLTFAIILLVVGAILFALGILNSLEVLDNQALASIFSNLDIYVGLLPNKYGVPTFGFLLLFLSVIVFSFRQRKPYSLFLPFYLIGVYATLGVFLRLCYDQLKPDFLFVTLRHEAKSMPLLFILIVIELVLMVTLLIATSKLDNKWKSKRDLIRRKLENEGVLVSKEDMLAQREKARIDKDSSLTASKERKEAQRLEKDRLKAEKKELRRIAKERHKSDKNYEKTREDIERKKELQEDRESAKARKLADKKAYLESVEDDKRQIKARKEEKKRRKEQKRLEKEKKRQGEAIESTFEVPQGPANPNKPLEFPDLPDIAGLPEFERVEEKKNNYKDQISYDRAIDDNNPKELEEPIEDERPRYDLSVKRYKAGGMLEATLEMMNKPQEDTPQAPQKAIIGYDDREDVFSVNATATQRSENANIANNNISQNNILKNNIIKNDISKNDISKNDISKSIESHDSIAPSNLSPTHPRYKMFESLVQAPQPNNSSNINIIKEEKDKIAPSNLSPSHPRYKMFEALKSNGVNSVSHYPSKAFEPELQSTPTTDSINTSKVAYNMESSSYVPVREDVNQNTEPHTEPYIESHIEPQKPYIKEESFKPIDNTDYNTYKPDTNYNSYKSDNNYNVESTKNDIEEPIDDTLDDIPTQTESLDLSVGIGGLVSNNAGYSAIMQRERRLYTAPPVTLLKDYPGISSDIDEYTHRQGEIIVETYAQQKTQVHLSNIIKGPTVTMYELTLDNGTLISRVSSQGSQLNYALGGKHVRILAPIPGKRAVGIEVPNEKTSIVGFKDMIYSLRANEKYTSLRVPMILGKTITGEPIVIDVAKMPHMIIAGTTGSGKSVCINSFINTLIYQKSPTEVRLVLVDPKVVELSLYNGIPHLLTPVITEAKKVVKMLNFLVEEMERRYSMLSNLGVRNIDGYNQKLRDEHIAAEKMPYIVLIMDEFADMMSVVGKDIEIQISRLAAKARAAGIHLILATQRPSSDVITGTIKSNLPARIAFAVSSSINSRVILDEGGAENLLGKGDMLLLNPSSMGLMRIQGAFLSDGEVEAIVSFAKTNGGEPDYLDDAIFEDNDDKHSDDDFGDSLIGDEDSDEVLFEEAKKIVYERKSASASYLQRRMKIGYNRAARLIEMMEEKGIIGPANGSKPREILKFE